MRDTTARLAQVRAVGRARAFAVIGEAVWWVTIVDATLVRHHPDAQPAPGPLTPRGQAWEMTRYRAYLARLAGRAIGEAFGCTAAFLTTAAAQVPTATDDTVRAALLGPPPRLVRNPGHEDGQRAGA
jgi:hypothetical protein